MMGGDGRKEERKRRQVAALPMERFAARFMVAICLVGTAAPLRAADRFYEKEPFDQITLNAENDNAVLQVQPLKLPGRKVPAKPRPSDKLTVELLDKPGQKYEIAWRSIVKVELFEEMVVNKAEELIQAGQIEEANEYLQFLEQTYPRVRGLATAGEDCLLAEAKGLHRAKDYENALAVLLELHRRNPRRAEAEKALAVTIDPLVAQRVAEQNYTAARGLIRTLAARYPEQAVVTKWEGQWKAEAGEAIRQSRAAFDAGDLRKADDAFRRALQLWPDLPEARALGEALYAKYTRVRVGVTSVAGVYEPGRLHDWAARRTFRLLYRTLMEFFGPGPEGGRYYCPVGQMKIEDLGLRLVFQLRPGMRWSSGEATLTGQELARQLLAMTDPRDPGYQPEWADVVESISPQSVQTVIVDLRRPFVRPEALLQAVLVPREAVGVKPPLTNGPYLPGPRTDEEIRFLANPQYSLAGPRQPKEIVERFFRRGAQAAAALQRREIDLLDRVNPWDLDRLKSREGLVVEPYAAPLVHCLVPNKRKPLMAHRAFCRALVYALRREAILKNLLGGKEVAGCQVVSGPFSPGTTANDPLDYAYDTAIAPRPYEPRLAIALGEVGLREVLKKSGKEARTMTKLVLAHPPHEIAQAACKSIARQLEIVGITVTLKELPPGALAPMPDDVDLLYAELAMWEPLVDARRLLAENSLSGGCSPYMSQALSQLQQAVEWLDVGARLRQIHRIACDDVAVIPLWQWTDHFAYHRSLKGVGKRPAVLYQNVEQWQPSLHFAGEGT